MERWPESVYDYITGITRLEDPLLTEMEERAKRDKFPIVGPLIGPWLYMFTRLIQARHVFEMGSGFGYSTWYFASALKANGGGTVTHTVWDDALSNEAKQFMDRARLLPYCEFEVSEATLALEMSQPGLDIVFLDIDKEGYCTALKVIETKLRPGGLLLVDNVLWSGRVLDSTDGGDSPGETSEATIALRKFNSVLGESHRWEYVVNPLRDGLGVAMFHG